MRDICLVPLVKVTYFPPHTASRPRHSVMLANDDTARTNGHSGDQAGPDLAADDMSAIGVATEEKEQCHSLARCDSSTPPLSLRLAEIPRGDDGSESGQITPCSQTSEEITSFRLPSTSTRRHPVALCEDECCVTSSRNSVDFSVASPGPDSPSTYSEAEPFVPWAKRAESLALATPSILTTIISEMDDASLRTALLVNRQWSEIATSLAWRNLTINGLPRILSTVPEWRGELVCNVYGVFS